jgi:hypothetical protein
MLLGKLFFSIDLKFLNVYPLVNVMESEIGSSTDFFAKRSQHGRYTEHDGCASVSGSKLGNSISPAGASLLPMRSRWSCLAFRLRDVTVYSIEGGYSGAHTHKLTERRRFKFLCPHHAGRLSKQFRENLDPTKLSRGTNHL